MQRRGFLGAMLAACTAPAFVRSGVLMPINAGEIIVPDSKIIVPEEQVLPVGASILTASNMLALGAVFTVAGQRDKRGQLIQFTVTSVVGSSMEVRPSSWGTR